MFTVRGIEQAARAPRNEDVMQQQHETDELPVERKVGRKTSNRCWWSRGAGEQDRVKEERRWILESVVSSSTEDDKYNSFFVDITVIIN